jgi:NADH-quinone oxidoreductase subunit N
MTPDYLNDLHYIWPEVVMTVAILLALFSDLILGGRDQKVTGTIAALCTALVIYFLIKLWLEGNMHRPFGIMLVDGYALFFKLLAAIGLLVVLLYSIFFKGFNRDGIGEFYAVILTATLGIFFLVSTDHLLLLYLALEMLSLTSYVLAGFLKRDMRSSEAALKYLVFGALSSGIMVFGFSIFFGLAGNMRLDEIGAFVGGNFANTDYTGTIIIASIMVLTGFSFKIASFPFHFWCPDVYEGAPTPVTTFLAVSSKAAGFGLLIRFFHGVFATEASYSDLWGPKLAMLIAVLSAVTMTYGNITAMRQSNLKRLLAYSSIAHAGYMLMGLAALLAATDGSPKSIGIDSILFYLVTYLIMNLGAFGFVMYMSNRYGQDEIAGYRGLGWKSPYASAFMTIFLLSLTGIPPTIGFIGKWKLFYAVIDEGIYWLAVCAAVNSVISLFYYFRIVKALFLRTPSDQEAPAAGGGMEVPVQGLVVSLLAILGIATLYYGVYWDAIDRLTRAAVP